MIYKYKLYRTLDHWDNIYSFYDRKVRKWLSEEKLISREEISLNDLLTSESLARSEANEYSNFKTYIISVNRYLETFGIEDNSAFFLGTKDTLGICLDTSKITDNIVFKHNFAAFVANLDTFRFFKYYLRETGLAITLTSHLIAIKASNKASNAKNIYVKESDVPCDRCLNSLVNFLKIEFNSIEHIEECYNRELSLCPYKHNCYDFRINNYLGKVFYQFQQVINKELESVNLVLKKVLRSEVLKPVEYSTKYNFAFIPRAFNGFTSQELSDITILFKNSLDQVLVYQNKKIYCPFNHTNNFTSNEDRCKATVPGLENPIKLSKIVYNSKNSIDESEQDILNGSVTYIARSPIPNIKSFKDTYCCSSTKRIKLDRAKLETINVKRDIRR